MSGRRSVVRQAASRALAFRISQPTAVCRGGAATTFNSETIMPVITPEHFLVEELASSEGHPHNRDLWISEPGGLTQFGAFVQELQPGTRSSIKHWHTAEDELVYVLAGDLTVVEGDTATILQPGDAATFKAGVALGHFLWNRGNTVAKCLVVGTRAPVDRITYPDHQRVCVRDRSQPDDIWTDLAGNPASNPYG